MSVPALDRAPALENPPALDSGPAIESAPALESAPVLESGPAFERLGADGLQRLRSRYAEILARIAERTPDPARRDELRASAERLNPDAWQTEEDVMRRLEEYETIFASLRQIVGHKRRRRRRGRRGTAPLGTTPSAPGTADAPQIELTDSPADDEPDFDGSPDDGPEGESGSGEL